MSGGSSVLDSDCIDAATLEEVSGLELIARGAVEGAHRSPSQFFVRSEHELHPSSGLRFRG